MRRIDFIVASGLLLLGCSTRGPSVDGMRVISDPDDSTPGALCTELHKAVCAGDLSEVKRMIKGGADVSRFDSKNEPPLFRLFWTTEFSDQHCQIVKELAKAGADVNWADPSTGDTALHKAAFGSNLQLVSVLVQCGADTRRYNHAGIRPIHMPIQYFDGINSIAVMDFLSMHGSSYDDRTESGDTCLEYAKKIERHEAYAFISDHVNRKPARLGGTPEK